MSTTTERSFEHVTARHARRLLVAGYQPSHAALDLAYQEAMDALEDDQFKPSTPQSVIDARWAASLELAPGCTLSQRMQALRKFWSV